MKRSRHRRQVLDVNGESDSPHRRRLQERYTHNGSPSNSLTGFVGQYNSTGESENDKPTDQLNDQVNDFLKEIQQITPNESNTEASKKTMAHPGSYWQECVDEQTGYPYYWHTETNQVTWEIPIELKMFKENSQGGNITPSTPHIPQWSKMSKFSDSQNNIPDGMIPKEVVARNRNRQAGIINKPEKPLHKSDSTKTRKRNESSDDEKIEMITSFGNEDSESEEEDDKQEISNKPIIPAPQSILKKPNRAPKLVKSIESTTVEGPMLPPVHYGPQNQEKLSEKLIQKTQKNNDTSDDDEVDILQKLKSHAKLMQSRENQHSLTREKFQNSSKNIRPSLVGYEDDSEPEEDLPKKPNKPLFPIAEKNVETSEKPAKQLETGSLKIYDYRNKDNSITDKSDGKLNDALENEKSDEHREESDSKTNKFLESIDMPSKGFKRKRRIAFDVAPVKVKTPEPVQTESSNSDEQTEQCNLIEESNNDEINETSKKPDKEALKKSLTINFVKSSSPSSSSSSTEENINPTAGSSAVSTNEKSVESTPETDADATAVTATETNSVIAKTTTTSTAARTEEEKSEVLTLTEPVLEKLKFLSEGSPAASPVQIMAIQLQTLISAWESSDLQSSYLKKWLQSTSCELTRLEQTAAPPGWECQWDRLHKRYYYRNATTGEAQWTYPQTDVVGGTEEMDLCTTPPPPEQEETAIIEMNVATSKDASESSTPPLSENQPEQTPPPPALQSTAAPVAAPVEDDQPPTSVPPPPIISSPSPPPPPKIYAEDLKRSESRKRKGSPYEEPSEILAKVPTTGGPVAAVHEPLPSPAYEPPTPDLAAAAAAHYALDPTSAVLYGTAAAHHQQPHPIYAATLAGAAAAAAAGLPLLQHPHAHHHAHHHPHPHPALVQGQLMHYNPAYHQHLHNQALVAARISNQEAAVQFMVAEYARVYENNQVIAKPPVKVTAQEASLGSALNSFYSDIASIEKAEVDLHQPLQHQQHMVAESTTPPVLVQMPMPGITENPVDSEALKEKKKKKTKTGLSKKQKEMSSMVAKWQRAQKNYKDCD
ncbi:fibrous sheath CABYR-binding protein-like [Trichogramma pretiosum]|uniref:fibrous sheath CABYR-binding protein-like n=1 Tax=Trichogramma pretiosum TaxID=7493 RepID=UPI0006C9C241|nr:fibrous sheath CABYR-binding protein-like [Trichogramma pretiosum]